MAYMKRDYKDDQKYAFMMCLHELSNSIGKLGCYTKVATKIEAEQMMREIKK